MLGAADHFQDGEGLVHVLEGLVEVLARVVVQRQVRVAVSCLRVIQAQDSFLEDDALRLQFNCLQDVPILELNACQL